MMFISFSEYYGAYPFSQFGATRRRLKKTLLAKMANPSNNSRW